MSLEKVNGWVVININKATDESILNLEADKIITLSAGQELEFKVDSKLASQLDEVGSYVVITPEFSALNNVVPVSTYGALVA